MIKRKKGVKAIVIMVIVMVMLAVSTLPVYATSYEEPIVSEDVDEKNELESLFWILAGVFFILFLIALVFAFWLKEDILVYMAAFLMAMSVIFALSALL